LLRKPRVFGGSVSHTAYATHADILTSLNSTGAYALSFAAQGTLPYPFPSEEGKAIASVTGLSPARLSAQHHSTSELLRTLSRVAASKPTSWLSMQSYFL
jgi:hypothetical protein